MPNPRIHYRQILRDYFRFPKWQRRAMMVVWLLIIPLFYFPAIYRYYFKQQPVPADAIVITEVKELQALPKDSDLFYRRENFTARTGAAEYRESNGGGHSTTAYELFAFDPNTASAADWQRLGLRDKTIRTIQNYLGKGGRFRKPDDLRRIYGLKPDEADRLIPYVQIAAPAWAVKKTETQPSPYPTARPAYSPAVIDINTADTSSWIALPGIGSKLAGRIVLFREKLGGFYSIQQVAETYGLPDSVFQKIRSRLVLKQSSIKKININSANSEQLKHPYIRYQLANAIVQYRQQHGDYKTPEDLKKILLVDEALFNKLLPYLTVE